jgi:hypothetical protein
MRWQPLVCLLLFLGGAAAQEGNDAPWISFSPPKAGFSILLPAPPLEQQQTIKSPQGDVKVTTFVLDRKKEKGAYAVSLSEFPLKAIKSGTEERRLNNARDGAIASSKGKLKSEKRLTLQGSPGRELLIWVGDMGVIRTRIYAVKNRLYQVTVTGPGEWVTSKDPERFLGSFKIHP